MTPCLFVCFATHVLLKDLAYRAVAASCCTATTKHRRLCRRLHPVQIITSSNSLDPDCSTEFSHGYGIFRMVCTERLQAQRSGRHSIASRINFTSVEHKTTSWSKQKSAKAEQDTACMPFPFRFTDQNMENYRMADSALPNSRAVQLRDGML